MCKKHQVPVDGCIACDLARHGDPQVDLLFLSLWKFAQQDPQLREELARIEWNCHQVLIDKAYGPFADRTTFERLCRDQFLNWCKITGRRHGAPTSAANEGPFVGFGFRPAKWEQLQLQHAWADELRSA